MLIFSSIFDAAYTMLCCFICAYFRHYDELSMLPLRFAAAAIDYFDDAAAAG